MGNIWENMEHIEIYETIWEIYGKKHGKHGQKKERYGKHMGKNGKTSET